MSLTADPIVPIPSFDELSPAFRERARRGWERLGVNVNSLRFRPFRGARRGDAGLFRGGCEAHDSVQ